MTKTKESKRKRRSFSQINILVPNEAYRVAVRGFSSKVKLLNIIWYTFNALYTPHTIYTWFTISDYGKPVHLKLTIVFESEKRIIISMNDWKNLFFI